MNLKVWCDSVKNSLKWMPLSLHFYLTHHNIYFYNPSFCKYVQINCPDISESKSQFQDKNHLFRVSACVRLIAPNLANWVPPMGRWDPTPKSVWPTMHVCLFNLKVTHLVLKCRAPVLQCDSPLIMIGRVKTPCSFACCFLQQIMAWLIYFTAAFYTGSDQQ